jgi:hypothetical protein
MTHGITIWDKGHTVHCHTKNTQNPKNAKIVKFLNEHYDAVTLCDKFDGHSKYDRRHGMDTYLFC